MQTNILGNLRCKGKNINNQTRSTQNAWDLTFEYFSKTKIYYSIIFSVLSRKYSSWIHNSNYFHKAGAVVAKNLLLMVLLQKVTTKEWWFL